MRAELCYRTQEINKHLYFSFEIIIKKDVLICSQVLSDVCCGALASRSKVVYGNCLNIKRNTYRCRHVTRSELILLNAKLSVWFKTRSTDAA